MPRLRAGGVIADGDTSCIDNGATPFGFYRRGPFRDSAAADAESHDIAASNPAHPGRDAVAGRDGEPFPAGDWVDVKRRHHHHQHARRLDSNKRPSASGRNDCASGERNYSSAGRAGRGIWERTE